MADRLIRGYRVWQLSIKNIVRSWSDDVIVVSYPKSGRTWHRVILCKYLELLFGLRPARSVDSRKLTRSLGLPRVSYTHNGANFLHTVGPYHITNGSSGIWRNRKLILLVRDPKDVLTSAYFHARYRSRTFAGSLSDFIRHPHTGIEKYLVAHRRWFSHSQQSQAFLLQRYESMHEDAKASARRALEFIGVRIDEPALLAAVEFATFENMRRLEIDGYFESNAMRLYDSNDAARKIREGKVGDHKRCMSREDISYIEAMIAEIGYPFGQGVRRNANGREPACA